jgi:hypothetical protein
MTLSIKLCEIKRIENQLSFIQQSRFYTNKYLIEEKKLKISGERFCFHQDIFLGCLIYL